MTNKNKNTLYFLILPILLIIGSLTYSLWFFEKLIVPVGIIIIFSISMIVINISVVTSLNNRSAKVKNTKHRNNNSDNYYWFRPKIIFSRFRSFEWIIIWYSVFIASGIYIFGIIINTAIIHLLHPQNGLMDRDQSNLFANFLFGEGALIAFVALTITIYTLINTYLIKVKNESTIENKSELYEILKKRFDKDDPIWKNCSDKFVYIYDYSIALGMASDEEIFFNEFYEIFANFIKPDEMEIKKEPGKVILNKVKFQAIINNPKSNVKYYKKSYPRFNNNEVLVKNHLYRAHDKYITYLNEMISEYLCQKRNSNLKDSYSIYFEKTPDDYINNTAENDDIFQHVNMNDESLQKYRLNEDGFLQLIKSEGISNYNTVFFDDNIGIVRFIVTNKFVIQFVLGQNIHTDNTKKSAPAAGFLSEDIVLIERFKGAFEKYRNQIIEKYVT